MRPRWRPPSRHCWTRRPPTSSSSNCPPSSSPGWAGSPTRRPRPRWRWPPCPPTGLGPARQANGGRPSTRSRTSRPNWSLCAGRQETGSRLWPAICRWPTGRGRGAVRTPPPLSRAPTPRPCLGRGTGCPPRSGPGSPAETATTCGTGWWRPSRPVRHPRRSAVPPCSPAGRCATRPRRGAGCTARTWYARHACADMSPRPWRAGGGPPWWWERSTPRRCCRPPPGAPYRTRRTPPPPRPSRARTAT
ncbi:hypothetical protein SHIRM173S_04114 [Streptomyces hirsutus]